MPHSNKHMLSLFLSNICNLGCIYCYTSKSENENQIKIKRQNLDEDFAKFWIKEFFEKYNSRRIRFFWSWEPSLEFELMKSLTDYSREISWNNKVTVEIQTNGVFSKDIANWMWQNIDIIWVSSDWTPEIQDFYRPTKKWLKSSYVMEKNIKIMVNQSKWMVWIRSTIWEKNINKQKEMIKYFYDLWIKYIWTDLIFASVEESDYSENVSGIEYVKKYLEAKKYADELWIFYWSFYACNFDWKTKYHCRACLPMPHLTTDWYVSACDMAMFWEDAKELDIFIYWKWDKEKKKIIYDEDKIKYLQSRTVDNIEWCTDCEAKENCGWYCLWETMNETWSIFWKKKGACDAIKLLHKNMELNKWEYKYYHP